ncbi:hypothetical protein DL96DRAFT_1810742 [Flagelloscypha sp. PMI_526]|nr:hypothetical protein DL96DRAFT_1810742 [Flagelloscypha sp. PMI_526]
MSASAPSSGDGLRLLSFDGGGIRSITQALMVREMMHRVEEDHQLPNPPKVSDYFDMISGSGFGGLLAVMCGVFHMTGDQLVEEFVGLCKVLFSEDFDAAERTIRLEQEIGGLIAVYCSGGEERKMIGKDETCKTFVCAASSHNAGHPRLFRNYRSRTNPSPNCTVCEAIRATTALPGLFNPIAIRDGQLSESFVGGELRWNNPTDELTREAAREFTGRHVACIVSIGSGHPGHLSLSDGLVNLFPRIALDCERLADDMERRFGNTPNVFCRLSVEQGLENLAIDLSNLDALVSHTYSYLQSSRTYRDIDDLLKDLVHRPSRILVRVISGEVSAAPKGQGPRVCPPPTQYFTGRRAALGELSGHFNSGAEECHIAVLYGIGGGGKSQLGLKFIQQNRSRFTDVYFIDASSKFTLENDLIAIASGSSDEPSLDDALHMLRTRREEWLLFFDNADDPSLNLGPYISWSHGNVIITTRNREVCIHAPKCSIWVDRLELNDATELLLRGVAAREVPDGPEIAVEIVQELGCLALAIIQARAFIAKGLCSLSEYLPLYRRNRNQLLQDESAQTTGDYRYSVYTTWAISFNKLSSNATLLLKLFSFMHHDAIPSRILESAWEVYVDQDENAVPPILANLLSSFTAFDSTWDIIRFRTLVGELQSFSLLEFNPAQLTFSLHPLVQQWAQGYSQHDEEMIHATQTLLTLAIPRGRSSLDFIQWKSLVPHIQASVALGIRLHCTLLPGIADVFLDGGSPHKICDLYQQALTEIEELFGTDHLHTLGCIRGLANAYSELGRHNDALELNERALELHKQIFGEDDPQIIHNLRWLASTYLRLGKEGKALEVNKEALELNKRILADEHPPTLETMQSLALIYSDLGQHDNSRELNEKVLILCQQTLGEDHPYTVITMQSLARNYSDLGHHLLALELNEEVLKLMKRTQGEEHSLTLFSMGALARSYSNLSQHHKALQLDEEVLKLDKDIRREEHPNTLHNMQALAHMYSSLGRFHDALVLLEESLTLSQKVLGEEHPTTLTGMQSLAAVYSELGRHRNALELCERTLSMYKQVFGEQHPYTLTSTRGLARVHSDLGQHHNARELNEHVLILSLEIHGEEHPQTIFSMENLACSYSELGQYLNALELMSRF